MSYFGIIFGGMIAAIVLVVWYKWHKNMTGGEGSGFFPEKARNRTEEGSLEEFIAAYRRGDVSAKEAGSAPLPAVPAPIASAPREPAALPPGRRDPFLSGATKLAYYVCRSGLRDHHVFAHVRVQALCTGKIDASLAESEIGLLVCNAGMSIVAAIDIAGVEQSATDAAKAEYLRSLGIRYLRLSAKSLPKPEDIRTLLYRM